MTRRTVVWGAVLWMAASSAVIARAAPVRLTIQTALLPWRGSGLLDNRVASELHQEFVARHPGLTLVEFEPAALPGPQAGAGQIMSLAAQAGPDLMMIDFKDLGVYVGAGLVQPMDDLWAAWPENGRWPAELIAGLGLEGHQWMVPSAASIAMLAASERACAAEGISAGSLPRDWDGLIALARRLARPGRPGLALPGGVSLAYLWHALARQDAGGEIVRVTPDGISQDVAGTAGVHAAECLARAGAELRRDDGPGLPVFDDPAALLAAVAAEHLALGVTDTRHVEASVAVLPADRLRLAPVPGAAAAGPVTYVVAGYGSVLPTSLRDPALRTLAWEYQTTAMLTNGAFERRLLDLAAHAPGVISLDLASRFPAHPAVARWPASWVAAMVAGTAGARPNPPHPEFEMLCGFLAPELAAVVAGTAQPGEALRRAADRFEEAVHERSRRNSPRWRAAGTAALALFGLVLAWGLGRLWWTLRAEWVAVRAQPQSRLTGLRLLEMTVLFLPAAAMAAVFGTLPLVQGIRMSLRTGVLRGGGRFVGTENYVNALVSPQTHLAAFNTAEYLALSFLFCLVCPLVLALALTAVPVGRAWLRTALLLPSLAGAAVVAVVWRTLLAPAGGVNQVLGGLGLAARDWLGNPRLALVSIVLSQAWATAGATQLLFLAGLAAVPEELYEDAEMAGADLGVRFRQVTWPHLRPILGITLIGWLLAAVRTAEPVFLMTGGGPGLATHLVGLEIFNQAYVYVRFGYAMAQVWLLVSAVLLVALAQVRAVRRGEAVL